MEGGRWRVVSVIGGLVVVGAFAITVGGCGEKTSDTGVKTVRTERPAVAFAPLVRLHPDETAFPIAADRFIERSSLKWAGSTCVGLANVATGQIAKRKTPGQVPLVDSARLGDAQRPYVFESLDASCKPRRRLYRSTELTRPYDRGSRPAGLPRDEGFYLDLLSDSKDGDPPLTRHDDHRVLGEIPAYYETDPAGAGSPTEVRVTYWLLYAFGQSLGAQQEELTGHEGDWQRLQVRLSRRDSNHWRPVSITLGAGERARTFAWKILERSGSHPIVYAAESTHELYPEAGQHRRQTRIATTFDETATCDDCLSWRTWRRLLPVRREPWYGFGGGWGLPLETDPSSGPLGPRPSG